MMTGRGDANGNRRVTGSRSLTHLLLLIFPTFVALPPTADEDRPRGATSGGVRRLFDVEGEGCVDDEADAEAALLLDDVEDEDDDADDELVPAPGANSAR